MRYYFAPLEGLTDSIYRKLHSEYFPGIHKYFTPFLSPTIHRELTKKEQRELPLAHTLSYACVPQILTKVPADFNYMAQQCKALGYSEINLNLGCPSGTVTAKGKGAALLKDTEALDAFLDQIYSGATMDISVKTRIGFHCSDEFPALMEIFNKYPIKELIVHPRNRNAFYKGSVDMEAFEYALLSSVNPVCFNGNLCCKEDIRLLNEKFPQVESVMLGRGLIGDPGMLSENTDNATLQAFFDALLKEYQVAFGSSRNAMFRLKENFRYLLCKFEDSERLGKRLRKTTDVAEYQEITHAIFKLKQKPQLTPDW